MGDATAGLRIRSRSMVWKRIAKIAAWSLGTLLVLIGLVVAGGYFFLTSADFRSRLESEASAYSGRKTQIAKVAIDWGLTPHGHLSRLQVANSYSGKAAHMLNG